MSIPAWTRRNPLAAYVILACAISWIAVSPLVAAWFGLLPPIAPAWHWVGALGPITAAMLVTAATSGRDGLRELLSRMTRWRVGAAWWVLAVGSPVALLALAAVLLRLFGRPWPDPAPLQTALADPAWVANLVAASLAYGVGEEPGWRGFALPWLQAGRSALRATLILTVLWALWHTPYFTYRYHIVGLSGYAGFFSCFVAGAIWLTFLYNSSGGSVLMVILWHIVWNAVNVAGAAVSSDLVAVTNVLLIPLSLVALAVGGSRKLSWSEQHVIQRAAASIASSRV
jgi:membrane protease YdiL (CAAX protease family)